MAILDRFFSKRRLHDEVSAELRAHLDEKIAALQAQGLSARDAGSIARKEFGNATLLEERGRDVFRWPTAESIFSDVRFALRGMRRNSGFTIIAMLTLALGIGASSALFSMVEAVLLKQLPYRDPSRLAILWTDNVRKDLHEERTSYPNFEDWRTHDSTFEDLAFATAFTVNLTPNEEPVRLLAARTSANLFSLMGVEPILGRTFSSDEENRAERVIVISQGLWTRSFASSPDVVGKSLEVDGTKMAIVGVMPASFGFPYKNVDVWEPLTANPAWSALKTRRNTPAGFVVGRLKHEVTFSRAQADMSVIGAQLAQQYPQLAASPDFFGFGVTVMPFDVYVTGRQVRVALWLLFSAVLLVLVIACSNVASLLLSRSASRSPEFATRIALGAGKIRLVRQLLTESAVLYVASGALGIVFAAAGDRALIRLAPADIPRLHETGIDPGVLFFALGLSFLSAVVFGIFPALRVSRTDPNLAIRELGRHSSPSSAVARMRSLLVAGQFAVTVVLLVGAGLLVRSFLHVQQVDPGFRADHVLTARVVQSKLKQEAQWRGFYEQALINIRGIPGVESAGAIDNFFFASYPDETVVVEGRSAASMDASASQVTDDGISAGYFQSLGVPLLRGRFFGDQDGPSSPQVAIINATMARRFWPEQDPVGKRFKFAYQQPADPWTTVVGVVGDMHRDGLTRNAVSEIFLPLSQHPARGMDVVVRTSSDPASFCAAVRSAIHSVDKSAPIFNVGTLENSLLAQTVPRRFQTLLLSLFASLGVILSAIGAYGLMHYSVTQRTHEIGIRMALGAERFEVIRIVLDRGGRVAAVGILIGLLGSLFIERALHSLFFGVSATDPITFVSAILMLCLVAVAACYIPARRAASIDPIVALRQQ